VSAPPPGSVVAWWEDDGVAFGVVVGEEKQRLAVITAGGKDERIAPSRVAAVIARGPLAERTPQGRSEAAARAASHESEVRRRQDEVDVPTLWELVHERDEPPTEAALAELALGRSDEAARLATHLALAADGVRFARKTAGWQPREAVAVAEILAGRERVARRAVEKDEALRALARAGRDGVWTPSGSESERKILAALETLAVNEFEITDKERQLAAEAIARAGVSGDRPSESAFRMLRSTGRFASDDENLAIVRYGLRTEFPEEVLRAADEAAARGFTREGRRDLTALATITIDDAATKEIDDALSIADAEDGCVEIGIHIADPCAFVRDGDPVDLEARARGTTYYFPERKLLMIPPAISESAASLIAGEDRPALTFLVRVDATGRPVGHELVRSIIRVAARLDYDAADEILRGAGGPHEEALKALDRFAELRERTRRASGAIALRAPETEIRVASSGEMTLTRRDPTTPSQRVVAEAMVLAGEVAAGWLDGRRVPAIYRRQAPPDGRLPEADPALPGAVHVRATRRMLKRGEGSVHPGPHHGLGLTAYAQVTSPLRRYQDLAIHRQVAAVLDGAPPAHDAAGIQAILAATERSEGEGRRAERAVARYWMLRWLERAKGGTVTGVVVDTVPRPIVVLDETLLEDPVPSLVGAAVGDRVRLRIERVNPRADLLVLRVV
jgi:exoribonuclease II